MRMVLAVLVAVVSLPVSAANIRFEPPNPDSQTAVTAHVLVKGCGSESVADVTRSGNIIGITIAASSTCAPESESLQDLRADLGVLPPGIYDVVASPGALLIAIAEGFLPVTEANPSFRIQPNTIDEAGGQIRLIGPIVFCAAGPSPIICGSATVKIDGVDAPVISKGNGELLVHAPPHDPGVVDVVVQGDAGTFTRTAALNYFAWTGAYDPAFFERVLVPVFFSGPGAFDSQWRTELAVHNGNPFTLMQGSDGLFMTPCMPVCDVRLAGGASQVVNGSNIATGVVQFLPRQATPQLDFSLLVRDVSRDATDFGTSVPVVREAEMFTRTFSLVNVPSDPRYRIGLRLYAYDTIPTTMAIGISALQGGQSAGFTVTLLPAHEHAFLLIGNLLASAPQLIGNGPLRIDITPLEPGTRAWGYVSITNNETQHVTTIAPE